MHTTLTTIFKCFSLSTMVSRVVLSLFIILWTGWEAQAKNLALETNDVSDHFVSTSINFIVDIFLKHYTKKLVDEGKTEIAIGDFDRRFSTKVLGLDIEGAIEVEDGWCRNISTLFRTGEADMNRVGGDIVLSAHLGLRDLKVDFNNYDISLLGIHQKGKIHVSIGRNSLWLKLNVQLKPTCVVSLSEMKIEQLDDIEVDITNLGVFENLTDEITSWVINEVTDKFRQAVQEDVYPVLAEAVKKADICHYLVI